jgi:hypothetical protein
MPSLYNRVAGESVGRIAALSDGIFAVAMTRPHERLHFGRRAALQSLP